MELLWGNTRTRHDRMTRLIKTWKSFLIFQLGTYTIALCAKELNKPMYVLCESYKFVRLYPLNQQDMPNEFKVT